MKALTKTSIKQAVKWIERVCNLYDEKNHPLLTVRHLRLIHPDLSYKEAKDLLKFCNKHTIIYLACYGQGQIMFSKWLQSKTN